MSYFPPGSHSWDETAVSTTAGGTATKAAVAGQMHVITVISGHVDEAAAIQVLTGAAGATVAAEFKVDVIVGGQNATDVVVAQVPFEFTGTWHGTPGVAVAGKLANSNADGQVNICGYSIP